jgi:hypothetical protein
MIAEMPPVAHHHTFDHHDRIVIYTCWNHRNSHHSIQPKRSTGEAMKFVRTNQVLAAALTLILASGCNSGKSAPTPANFMQTLNTSFLTRNECLFPESPRFPLETSDPAQTKQFDALVKATLLTVAQEPAIHVSRYTVTTTGARYAPRFCYGHRNVTAIDSFTPPATANGFPETRVTYRYTIEDVPVWAKTPDVKAAFPQMAHTISTESTDQATLAQTVAGWTVPD